MGCACINPNTLTTTTFLSLDFRDKETERSEVITSKSAVVIQSNFRRMLTEKKLNETHCSLLSQFTTFISNNLSTEFVSDEMFLNKMSLKITKAKTELNSKINQFDTLLNSLRGNCTIYIIKMNEITPIEYIEGYKGIYKGAYKYNTKLDLFYRNGKGEFIDNDGDLNVTYWDTDIIKDNSNGIIYYSNGNCYMGEISQSKDKENKIVPDGKGTLYYPSSNYEDFRKGIWINGKESIQSIVYIKDKYRIEFKTDRNNDNDSKAIIIKYANNDRYEGEYININDTYIPQGKGTLFIPSQTVSNDKANEGKYITANWVNGLQSGPGEIIIKQGELTTTIESLFRFGKIIQSTQKMVKNQVSFHKNIFYFLSINENSTLAHLLKTKGMFHYLSENNQSNLNKIKIKRITSADNNRYPQYKKLSNDTLINNEIINIDSIFFNYSTGHSQLIPIVAYKTNGGMVEARFRYNNIFNPSIEKVYTTNYLMNLDKDIQIDGVINRNLLEEMQPKNKDQTDKTYFKQNSHHAFLKKRSSLSNRDHLLQEDMLNQSKKYIERYNLLEQYYSIEKYKKEIKDEEVINKHIGDIHKILFSIHEIVIQIPKQVDHYSYLTNPVRHIAIYISNNDSNAIDDDIVLDINEDLLSMYDYDIKRALDSKNITPLVYNDNDIFTSIEFDSEISDKTTRRLLCLIEIKEYTFTPFTVCFKQYYHFAKYISVKLINQSTLFNAKKTCIDMGTINFFGQVYYLK